MVAIDVIARDKASKKFDKIGKSAEGAASKMSSIGKKSTEVGKSMTKKVTLPILGLAAGAVKAADSVGDSMNDIKIATGATGDKLTALQDVAKGIAKTTPNDIKTVSAAIGALNTQTGATGPVLQNLTSNVLEASRVLGEDGAANADAFGRALNQANIPASKGGPILDALFASSQQYGTSIGGMLKNLQMFGPQMQSAGLDMKDTISLFGQFNKAGVSANRIVPSLNAAFLKWSKAGKDPQKMLGKLSKQIAGAKTQQEAMTAASQYFSGPGASAFVTAIRKGGVSLDKLGDSLDTSQVDIAKTGENTRTMGEQLTVLKNKAVLSLVPIGQKILPVVVTAFGKVGDIISKVTTWWSGLSGTAQKFIGIALGVIAAIGPALAIFGKLISIGLQVKKMIMAVKTAMIAMNAAMAANPILIVVAVLAALVAAFVVAYKKSETFRKIVNGAFQAVKKVVVAVVDWFKDDFVGFFTKKIPAAFQAVMDWIKNNWKKLLFGLITGPIGLVIAFFPGAKTKILGFFKSVWNWVKGTFKGLWHGIRAIFVDPVKAAWNWVKDTFVGGIKGSIGSVWTWIKGTFKGIWAGIKAVFVDPVQAAWDWVTGTFFGGITGAVMGVWDWAKGTFKGLWSGVKAVFIDPPKAAWDWIKSTFVGGIKSSINGVWSWAKGTFKSTWSGIKAIFLDPVKAAWEWIQGLPDKISGLAGDMLDAGKGWISGLWDGIKSAAGSVGSFVGDLASSVVSAIKNGINNILNLPWRIHVHIPIPLAPDVDFGPYTILPRFAKGGMTSGPMAAIIGDNPGGKEAVLPLDSPRTVRALAAALREAGSSGGASGPQVVQNIYPSAPLDEAQLADLAARRIQFAMV